MAHAQWDTDNLRFRGTQAVGTSNDFICHNNTKCALDVEIAHSSNSVDTFYAHLGPGEGFAYRPGTSGTVTFTGTPSHSQVNVLVNADYTGKDGTRLPASSASLLFSPF